MGSFTSDHIAAIDFGSDIIRKSYPNALNSDEMKAQTHVGSKPRKKRNKGKQLKGGFNYDYKTVKYVTFSKVKPNGGLAAEAPAGIPISQCPQYIALWILNNAPSEGSGVLAATELATGEDSGPIGRLTPSDFKLKTLADDPKPLRIWNQTLRDASFSSRPNSNKTYLKNIDDGVKMAHLELV